jgi:hypothetical protein
MLPTSEGADAASPRENLVPSKPAPRSTIRDISLLTFKKGQGLGSPSGFVAFRAILIKSYDLGLARLVNKIFKCPFGLRLYHGVKHAQSYSFWAWLTCMKSEQQAFLLTGGPSAHWHTGLDEAVRSCPDECLWPQLHCGKSESTDVVECTHTHRYWLVKKRLAR